MFKPSRCIYISLVTITFIFSSLQAGTYKKYESGLKGFISDLVSNPLDLGQNQGGYKDYQISENQFSITYIAGDSESAPLAGYFHGDVNKHIKAHAFRRASELTKMHGFKYFTVTSEHWDKVDYCTAAPVTSTTWTTLQRKKNAITIKIKCFRQQPNQGGYCVR